MKNTKLKSIGLGLAMLMTSVAPTFAGELKPINGHYVTDIMGKNRIETSIMTANYLSGKTLVVTNGYSFPDALSAMNVMNKVDGRFILVDDKTDVKARFGREGIEKVYVIGGRVHPDVIKNIKKLTNNVTIFDGKDRYQTNEMTLDAFKYDKVGVADGRNYPDALASAPLLKQKGYGLKLVNGSKTYSGSREVKYTFGETVIQNGGKRLAGKDRYKTNVAINNELTGVKATLLVSGRDYPDALSAINMVKAVNGASISLLSYKNETMKEHLKNMKNYYRIGGAVTNRIIESVLTNKDIENKKPDDKDNKKPDGNGGENKPVPTPQVKKNVIFRIDAVNMPESVTKQIKADMPNDLRKHDMSTPLPDYKPTKTEIKIDGGKWVYKSREKSEDTNTVVFLYKWEYVKTGEVAPVPTPDPEKKDIPVTINSWNEDRTGPSVPDEVTSQFKNENIIVKEGTMFTMHSPDRKVVKTSKGTWTFVKWLENPKRAQLNRFDKFEMDGIWSFEKNEPNGNLSENQINEIKTAFHKYLNEYRKNDGKNTLDVNYKIADAATLRARELETNFSHTRPDGTKFSSVLEGIVSPPFTTGENAIYIPYQLYEDMSTDQIGKYLAEKWYNSEGHRHNMLYSTFINHNMGVYQGSNKTLYAADLFIDE